MSLSLSLQYIYLYNLYMCIMDLPQTQSCWMFFFKLEADIHNLIIIYNHFIEYNNNSIKSKLTHLSLLRSNLITMCLFLVNIVGFFFFFGLIGSQTWWFLFSDKRVFRDYVFMWLFWFSTYIYMDVCGLKYMFAMLLGLCWFGLCAAGAEERKSEPICA